MIREEVLPLILAALLLIAATAAPESDFARLIAQGRSHLDRGRNPEAEQVFRQAVAERPEDGAARYYLGLALLRQDKTAEAAAELERARRISPQNAAVLYELGTAYIRLESLDEAEPALAEAARLQPSWDRIRLQLGWVYYLKVEVERAAVEFRQALAVASTPLGHYYLGLAQAALGQVEEACASHRKALELDGKLAPAQVALGRALLRLNRAPEAEGAFRAAVALDPAQSEAHYQLGLIALEGSPRRLSAPSRPRFPRIRSTKERAIT